MNGPTQLTSEAWLLRGVVGMVGSVPGELKLSSGRVCFTAFGSGTLWKWQLRKLERDVGKPGLADRMNNGENTLVFDVPLAEANARFPWLYFGGLKVKIAGIEHRFMLCRPPNTCMPVGSSKVLKASTRIIELFQDFRKMVRLWTAWKTALIEYSSTN